MSTQNVTEKAYLNFKQSFVEYSKTKPVVLFNQTSQLEYMCDTIYFEFDDIYIHATPFYEGINGIPVDISDIDGNQHQLHIDCPLDLTIAQYEAMLSECVIEWALKNEAAMSDELFSKILSISNQ